MYMSLSIYTYMYILGLINDILAQAVAPAVNQVRDVDVYIYR